MQTLVGQKKFKKLGQQGMPRANLGTRAIVSSALVYIVISKFRFTFLPQQMVLSSMECNAEKRLLDIRIIFS